jgi:hypothetical protein
VNGDRARPGAAVLLVSVLVGLLAGCGSSGSGQSGSAFVFLTIRQFSPSVVTSSLDDQGTSTMVCVTIENNLKNPTVTAPTTLDNVTITTYTVSFTRLDGGPPPGPFTFNTAFTVPAGTIAGTPATATGNAAAVLVILVPAQAKRQPPLSGPRPPNPLSTTATIIFRGRDGRGQGHTVEGAVGVTFIRGPETEPGQPPACSVSGSGTATTTAS